MAVVRTTVARLPGQLRAQDAGVRAAIRAAALESAERTLRRVRADSPSDIGNYKNSWDVVPGTGNEIARLRNNAPHAGIIEFGARPHRISQEGFDALVEWVLRHKASFGLGNRRKRGRAGDIQRAAAVRIATAIAFKIRRYGQKPKRVLGKQRTFALQTFDQEVERRLNVLARQRE